MPAYEFNWWYSLYFITYIIINTYIFMSVFLAVIYNNYRKHLKVSCMSGTGQAPGLGTVAGRLASAFVKYLKASCLFALVNLKSYLVSCSVLLIGWFFPGLCDGSDSA